MPGFDTRAAALLLLAGALSCASCQRTAAAPPLFELVAPEASGVTFVNELPEDTAFNILNYLYYYNGGGVAAGDVDGDGLPDLYLTSNLGPDRLYRNKGHFRFEDITERAGVTGPPGWTSGVTMADVNGDGRLDIYVSAVSYLGMHGRNVLYVNNGDGTFTDRTDAYGLEHVGYATQAAFLDYDGDGDLDVYLLNSSTHTERAIAPSTSRTVRRPAFVSTRTTSCAIGSSPCSQSHRARQRMPLPHISASEASRLKIRMRISALVEGRTTSSPSAPMPKWRSQTARASRGQSASNWRPSTRTKSLPVPWSFANCIRTCS